MHPVLAVGLVLLVGFVLGISFGRPVPVPLRRTVRETQRENLPILTIEAAFGQLIDAGGGRRAICVVGPDGYTIMRDSWLGQVGGTSVVFLE